MKNSQFPKVAVLLAAYNGEKYIQEQIESIVNQVDVDIHIYISIDSSTDRTLEICKQLQKVYKNICIINNGKERFGSAGKNFYHLIKNVDFNRFDLIALSDQDDIWKFSKIIHGINMLEKNQASGYSSDVECFWDDGSKKNKIIKKSYSQKKYDFLFEPAGPGCTYILKKDFSCFLQSEIKKNTHLPFHHDWYIYALAREKKFKWHIDDSANIYYRQHISNQVGANTGISQKYKRIKKLISGKFKEEHKEIISSINKSFSNEIRFQIFKNPFLFRRNNKEAILLWFFLLLGWI